MYCRLRPLRKSLRPTASPCSQSNMLRRMYCSIWRVFSGLPMTLLRKFGLVGLLSGRELHLTRCQSIIPQCCSATPHCDVPAGLVSTQQCKHPRAGVATRGCWVSIIQRLDRSPTRVYGSIVSTSATNRWLLSARNALITLNTASLKPPILRMSARSQA